MKDRFEEFIKENREEFDIHSPDPEIWNRIAQKKKKRSFYRKKILKILYRAAAVALIFVLSYAYHEFRDYRKDQQLAEENLDQIYKIIPELKETELYYNNLVNMKMEELQPFFTDQPEVKEEISKDLNELDSIYVSLKQDLLDNIANDQVIEAMIQNYRLKLEILEELLYEVQNLKENGKTEKDNYSI